jgi:hypothetical protein
MRLVAAALLVVMIGCGGSKPAPNPSPTPDPGSTPPELALLCPALEMRVIELPGVPVQITASTAFTAIAFGAPTAAQGAAAAGPGCPDAGAIQKLGDCVRDPRCGRLPSADDLAGLRKRAETSGWVMRLLDGRRIDVLAGASGTLLVMDAQLDVSRALRDLFPGHSVSQPVGAMSLLPCGANLAPCQPPAQPECAPTTNPTPRFIGHLGIGASLQCLDCDAVCHLSQRPADCVCARQCQCSGS